MSLYRYAPDGDSPAWSQQTGMRRKKRDLVQRYDGLWVEKSQNDPDPRRNDGREVHFTDPTPHRQPLPRFQEHEIRVKPFGLDRRHFGIAVTAGQPRIKIDNINRTYYAFGYGNSQFTIDRMSWEAADVAGLQHHTFTIDPQPLDGLPDDTMFMLGFANPRGTNRPITYVSIDGASFNELDAFTLTSQEIHQLVHTHDSYLTPALDITKWRDEPITMEIRI